MSQTVLAGIIGRLKAMTYSQAEREVRRFEVNGVERARMTYLTGPGVFLLHDLFRDHVYVFDRLYLAEIEVFELLD